MNVKWDRHNVEGQEESALTEGEGEGRNCPCAVFHCGKSFAVLRGFELGSKARHTNRERVTLIIIAGSNE